jgi:hypothetical protein
MPKLQAEEGEPMPVKVFIESGTAYTFPPLATKSEAEALEAQLANLYNKTRVVTIYWDGRPQYCVEFCRPKCFCGCIIPATEQLWIGNVLYNLCPRCYLDHFTNNARAVESLRLQKEVANHG